MSNRVLLFGLLLLPGLCWSQEKTVSVTDEYGSTTMCLMVEQPNRRKFSLRGCTDSKMRERIESNYGTGAPLMIIGDGGARSKCKVLDIESTVKISRATAKEGGEFWGVLCDR